MSTAMAPETRQRVRHPLDAVRSHIRRYVLLETLAGVLVVLALWFWVGLFFDFGSFWAFAYDWVLELNFADGGVASKAVRISIAAIVVIGLIYVIATRLFMRMWREFSDPAVALVLERRFPRELGDRLITAVELADPKKAESYGFSGEMLAKTIDEAADRVERLPVSQVFDWARLRRRWYLVAAMTIGMFVFAMGLGLGLQSAMGAEPTPGGWLWNFYHNASIWTERNVLMADSYWLRNSHLEVVRFHDNASHPGEMRVGREDSSRPEVVVRAVSWVVPDASAVGGWRALKVGEAAKFLPEAFAKIDVPDDWPGWAVDLDDVDSRIPVGVVPAAWQGWTVGEVRKQLAADPALRRNLLNARASATVESLGDWKAWTLDKLVRQRLNAPPSASAAIEQFDVALAELAASPSMNRSLRRLETPTTVMVFVRGQTTRSSSEVKPRSPGRFPVDLNEFKESSTFYARGRDAYTPPLKVALVPPPAVREISVDKAEPAYRYHWLAGSQAALKGRRQLFPGVKISVGELSTLDVPLGTNVKMHVVVDRPLKEGIRIGSDAQVREPGVVVPNYPVVRDPDGLGFTVEFPAVDRVMDFQFEFNDEDNVKGRRKVRIRPIDDAAPEVLNFELAVVLRKARSKDGLAGGTLDGLLVTPDALLPLAGTVRDDVGLTDVRWVFETQPITIEPGSPGKPGRVVVQGSSAVRRAIVVMSAMQFTSPRELLIAPGYLGFVNKFIEADLKSAQPDERDAPLAGFQEALKAEEEETIEQVDKSLVGKPPRQRPFLREHVLKDREFFSVKQHLPDLRTKDPKTQAQILHTLRLSLSATDNNVETGPGKSRTRTPITFLVVPETELLAQVALEEESLRDRLQKTYEKIKAAQTTLGAQLPIMRSAKAETDYSLVALRVDEVRKALLDAGSATREMHADYNRILQELQVNRVRRDKVSDVQLKIVAPLDAIVNPKDGNYALLEDILEGLSTKLDGDIASKQIVPKLPAHVKTATLAGDEIARLIRELEQVLQAISGGIDDARLLEIALGILRDQESVGRPLREYHDQKIRELIDSLK